MKYSRLGLFRNNEAALYYIIHKETTEIAAFNYQHYLFPGFLGGTVVKNPSAVQVMQETRVRSLGWEDPLEEGMTTHFSALTWRIPWTEEPGGLQSLGSQRAGHH